MDESTVVKYSLFKSEDTLLYTDVKAGNKRVLFTDAKGVAQIQFCDGDAHFALCYDWCEGCYVRHFVPCENDECYVFNIRPDSALPCSLEDLLNQRYVEQVSEFRRHYSFSYKLRRPGYNTGCEWTEKCDGHTHVVRRHGFPEWASQCIKHVCHVYHDSRPLPQQLRNKQAGTFDPSKKYSFVDVILHGVSYATDEFVKHDDIERCVDGIHFHMVRRWSDCAVVSLTVWDCDGGECAVHLCRPRMKFPKDFCSMKKEVTELHIKTKYNNENNEFEHVIVGGNFQTTLICQEKCTGIWHTFISPADSDSRPEISRKVCANELCGVYRRSLMGAHSPASFLKKQAALHTRY